MSFESGSMCLRVVHSSVHVQLSAVLSGRPGCNVSTADGSSCRYANLLRTLLYNFTESCTLQSHCMQSLNGRY
jgi:hypothetical protein